MTIKQRYRELKEQLSAYTILLIRVGEFYEAFDVDAAILASRAEINETPLPGGGGTMAGFPAAMLDTYRDRLLADGYSVAVAGPVAGQEHRIVGIDEPQGA